MYLLTDIVEDIGEAVVNALRTLALSIFEALLKGIDGLFNLFMEVVEWHELVKNTEVQQIFIRISLILGIFMVFRLTFSAIEYLINPDTMTDKEKGLGNIVKKVLIMIILLGSVRFLFNEAYEIQDILLNNTDDVLYKLVLGKQSGDASEKSRNLVLCIFDSFYICKDSSMCTSINETTEDDILQSKNGPDFTFAFQKLNKKENNKYIITFDWLFAILTAVFILYILIVYTIQVSVRVFQLTYLQIIAPIPIMMYLTPKGEEKLKKWGQQCLTTFLDAFIRIVILYFIILVIGIMNQEYLDLFSGGISLGIVLMLGLFMFAKKVPDLLGELFPSMGGKAGLDFGIKTPKQLWSDLKSTPVVGLAAKGIGYGANKGYKTYKANREVRRDLRNFDKSNNKGRNLYNKYPDELDSNEFRSSEYRASYEKVKEAKGNVKQTERELRDSNAAFAAAYNSGDTAKITAARERLDRAEKNHKVAQAKLEQAKQRHEYIKKIHKHDAAKEDAYNRYKDLNPTFEEYNSSPISNPQSVPSGGSSISSQSTPSGGPQPVSESTPWVSPQQREEDAYNRFLDVQGNGGSDEEVQSALQDYENARQARQELDNDLDDFYERQNDGYGGQ